MLGDPQTHYPQHLSKTLRDIILSPEIYQNHDICWLSPWNGRMYHSILLENDLSRTRKETDGESIKPAQYEQHEASQVT